MPHFHPTSLVFLASLAFAGCGPDRRHTDVTPDAMAPDTLPDATPEPICPPDTFCLKPRPVQAGLAIPHGRLGIVFYPLYENSEVPAVIAVDLPFDPAAPLIEIPLASIRAPEPADPYQLCARECDDIKDPECGCLAGKPAITLAYVGVTLDANGSGVLEPEDFTSSTAFGIGYVIIGGADQTYPVPNELDYLFPDGIAPGVTPYRIINATPFDQLGRPTPGAVFDLDLCVPGDIATCSLLRAPDLT